jgi:hypothetical protein
MSEFIVVGGEKIFAEHFMLLGDYEDRYRQFRLKSFGDRGDFNVPIYLVNDNKKAKKNASGSLFSFQTEHKSDDVTLRCSHLTDAHFHVLAGKVPFYIGGFKDGTYNATQSGGSCWFLAHSAALLANSGIDYVGANYAGEHCTNTEDDLLFSMERFGREVNRDRSWTIEHDTAIHEGNEVTPPDGWRDEGSDIEFNLVSFAQQNVNVSKALVDRLLGVLSIWSEGGQHLYVSNNNLPARKSSSGDDRWKNAMFSATDGDSNQWGHFWFIDIVNRSEPIKTKTGGYAALPDTGEPTHNWRIIPWTSETSFAVRGVTYNLSQFAQMGVSVDPTQPKELYVSANVGGCCGDANLRLSMQSPPVLANACENCGLGKDGKEYNSGKGLDPMWLLLHFTFVGCDASGSWTLTRAIQPHIGNGSTGSLQGFDVDERNPFFVYNNFLYMGGVVTVDKDDKRVKDGGLFKFNLGRVSSATTDVYDIYYDATGASEDVIKPGFITYLSYNAATRIVWSRKGGGEAATGLRVTWDGDGDGSLKDASSTGDSVTPIKPNREAGFVHLNVGSPDETVVQKVVSFSNVSNHLEFEAGSSDISQFPLAAHTTLVKEPPPPPYYPSPPPLDVPATQGISAMLPDSLFDGQEQVVWVANMGGCNQYEMKALESAFSFLGGYKQPYYTPAQRIERNTQFPYVYAMVVPEECRTESEDCVRTAPPLPPDVTPGEGGYVNAGDILSLSVTSTSNGGNVRKPVVLLADATTDGSIALQIPLGSVRKESDKSALSQESSAVYFQVAITSGGDVGLMGIWPASVAGYYFSFATEVNSLDDNITVNAGGLSCELVLDTKYTGTALYSGENGGERRYDVMYKMPGSTGNLYLSMHRVTKTGDSCVDTSSCEEGLVCSPQLGCINYDEKLIVDDSSGGCLIDSDCKSHVYSSCGGGKCGLSTRMTILLILGVFAVAILVVVWRRKRGSKKKAEIDLLRQVAGAE